MKKNQFLQFCNSLVPLTQRKRIQTILFVLFATLGFDQQINAQCTCTGNLVANPSFESGTTSWTWSGGNFNAGTGAVKCGSKSGDFEITNSSNNGVYQVVGTDLAIGTVINANVWSGTHNNSYSHKVFIHFYNASNVYMSTGSVEVEVDKVLANSPTGPQLYTFSATVPSGAKYTRVGFKGTGNWVKTDMWCVTTTPTPCNAEITNVYFNKLDGGADITITNGSTYTSAQLGSLYNIEASTTGTVGSVKFTITGPTASTVIENAAPYNSPGTGSGAWVGAPGSYTLNVKAYSASGGTGTVCDEDTRNFTIANDCSCPGNVLTNPSFENTATGWSVSGGTLTFGTSYKMCGSYNGYLNHSSGTAKVWQDVTISAGSVLSFKGYAGTHNPGLACSPKLSLIFYNSANAVISQSDAAVTFDVGSGNQLALYTINATAPAGTVKVRVQGSITCNTLKVDGFCLTVAQTCPGGGIWNLNLPNGTLGTSQTYTVNGKTITAYGFNNGNPGTPTALYGKNLGGDETGLGINSNVNQEIDINHFVQLDLNQIIAAGVTSGTMMIGSMQAGEPAKVFGSNSLGIQGTLLMTVPVTLNNTPFPIPGFPAYRYISVQAGAPTPADVLLQQVSFSCPTTASLGDFVFEDYNRNGVQDAGEPGIPNATVVLKDGGGITIGTTTTDANGIYSFTNLAPGTYSVTFTTPATYVPTLSNIGADDTKDSDPVAGVAAGIVLTAGQNNTTIDAGFYRLISISGNVWHDVNAMSDGFVNNTGPLQSPPALAIPPGLRAYLVNASTGLIEQLVFVNPATGTFLFPDVSINSVYNVVLSSSNQIIGNPPPASTLPSGWIHTGQKNANPPNSPAGSDGLNDGKLVVPTGTTDVINVNFGIKILGGDVVLG